MNRKKFILDYFSFSRRDRIAVITLVIIICLVSFLPAVLYKSRPASPSESTAWVESLKSPENQPGTIKDAGKADPAKSQKRDYSGIRRNLQLFFFDPNNTALADWQRLGLRDKTIRTIQNYLSKGGQFRKPEDLKKIYGLFEDEYERVAPFIKIDNRQSAISPGESEYGNYPKEKRQFQTLSPGKSNQHLQNNNLRYSIVDINMADTTALIALPGIGSKLAARIIHFRNKLGGFYSIEQIGETFGLADSTFQKIKKYLTLGDKPVQKLNINVVSLEELKAHPYVRYVMANAIINYRNEHGGFKRVEDLKNVMAVTDDIYNKIVPYFIIEKY